MTNKRRSHLPPSPSKWTKHLLSFLLDGLMAYGLYCWFWKGNQLAANAIGFYVTCCGIVALMAVCCSDYVQRRKAPQWILIRAELTDLVFALCFAAYAHYWLACCMVFSILAIDTIHGEPE